MLKELLKNLVITINKNGFFIGSKLGDYLRDWEIEALKRRAWEEPLFKEEEDA